MHMADALISPAVGGALWAVSGGLLAFCARKVPQTLRDNLVPMMGVLGAFIFAAQMINFSIPGTGSSGHLGGGLILTVLLGPYAAFLVIASVLTVQAFFFADGGLLALGCNIFNLGFFPAFIAYPLIYRAMVKDQHGTSRAWVAALVAAVVGLQLGAFSVVLETKASGISALPFGTFVLIMLPIHLAIGVVEGLATAAVVAFVARARPEALPAASAAGMSVSLRPVLIGLAIAAVVMGGVASWFASTQPDGLEWSIAKVIGRAEVAGLQTSLHGKLAGVQQKTAVLPDYGFKATAAEPAAPGPAAPEPKPWPAVSAGTSVAGLLGGLLTLAFVGLVGFALKTRAIQRVPDNS
ncbi:MAG: energy-coupling factor ABC transporter permease [Kiritimatiellaeota bacterium]|nr:energy-coupling factor ABC transporter permease [Kiritimatiellota bacterium]